MCRDIDVKNRRETEGEEESVCVCGEERGGIKVCGQCDRNLDSGVPSISVDLVHLPLASAQRWNKVLDHNKYERVGRHSDHGTLRAACHWKVQVQVW